MVKRINTQQIASAQVLNTAKLSLFSIFHLNIQANESRFFLTGFPNKSYNEDSFRIQKSAYLKVVILCLDNKTSIHVAIALDGCNDVYNSTSIGKYYSVHASDFHPLKQ